MNRCSDEPFQKSNKSQSDNREFDTDDTGRRPGLLPHKVGSVWLSSDRRSGVVLWRDWRNAVFPCADDLWFGTRLLHKIAGLGTFAVSLSAPVRTRRKHALAVI